MSLPAFFRSLSVNNIHCLLLRPLSLVLCCAWLLSLPILVLASAPTPAFANSAPAQFCNADKACMEAGGTCTITGKRSVDDLADLDFGNCDVLLEGILDVKSGSMTLRAKSFTMAAAGQIKGVGTKSLNGGNVTIETSEDIVLNSTRIYGAIRLNGRSGGTLSLTSAVGSVKGIGKLVLNNIHPSGFGGSLSIRANSVNLTGEISAAGGSEGIGGSIYVEAENDVSMMGDIVIKGSSASFEVLAGGKLELADLDANGKGDGSGDGEINLHAEGPVDVHGVIESQGVSAWECGDGGDLTVFSPDSVTFHDRIDLDARAGDCVAGELDVTAKTVVFKGMVRVANDSPEAAGGSVSVTADDYVRVHEGIKTHGGTGGAGPIQIVADGNIVIYGDLSAIGFGPHSPGNTIELRSEGLLAVAGEIVTSGGFGEVAGDVSVSGCKLIVDSGISSNRAKIEAEGTSNGKIEIVANNELELVGVFRGNTFIRYGKDTHPVDISGAEFFPPSPTEDPNWPIALCTFAD